MRVCFLAGELGRSGGAATIRSYADGLRERGFQVDLVDPGAVPAGVEPYDVAIATWWPTALELWAVPARRRALFLQSVESRFYEERHYFERLAAEEVLALPVAFVTVAGWIRELLAELRPDAPCDVVRGGVDKEVFERPHTPRSGPLRVLVEGQPSMWFKGVHEALGAVRAMAEPAEVTVVAGQPEDAGEVAARVVGGLDADGMARLYADHDVVVKLSRVESLGLAPIEAAHAGTPAVVTPYTGHDEHVVHGRNGLVVGFDDEPGTARALDRLARDPGLLERLSDGARESARDWPSHADAAEAFAAAVQGIAERPPPDAEGALAPLARASRRRLELTREHARQDAWFRHAFADATEHIEELNHALGELRAILAAKDRQIEEIRSERAYRAAVRVRRLLPGGDR
ncbi:MAG TPA: glycosyltransferase family 4 protein [Thermoleophilaceae bacterium]|nr:glycosyltransferase family 4 protein [Thermoleophilaceae bacterium]